MLLALVLLFWLGVLGGVAYYYRNSIPVNEYTDGVNDALSKILKPNEGGIESCRSDAYDAGVATTFIGLIIFIVAAIGAFIVSIVWAV